MTPLPTLIVRYRGRSMWPVFQEGDLVEVERLPIDRVRRGDCVLFRSAAGWLAIHRVVTAGDRLRTRGDALPANDLVAVSPDCMVGRVIRRYRQGRAAPVRGGWPGLLAGRFYRLAGRLDPARSARGGTAARTLQRLSMILLGSMAKQGEVRIVVRSGQEPVVVWYWGKWAVGRQDPRSGDWTIYWPWRMIFTAPRP